MCSVLLARYNGSFARPRCPVVSCWTRRRTSSRASPASLTTWNGSMTSTASGSSSTAAVLNPEKPSIATTSIPSRQPLGRAANHCLKTCFDRPGTISSRRAVPVPWLIGVRSMMTVTYLSPPASVAPHVLVDTDHRHVVESIRIVDQQPLSFGQDRGVRGMPGHRELVSDDCDGVVIDDEGTQCPIESGSRDLCSGWCRGRSVLAPHVAAFDALVATQADMQCRWPVAEGLVCQSTHDGVADVAVAATSSAPFIGGVRSAFQDGFVCGDVLADAGQVKGVESAECREVRRRESRLVHVEVFRMGSVRTSIIGRPRRLSG